MRRRGAELQGYEPFGSLLPGRNYNAGSYRNLFQGQLHDDEIYGATGTSYAFEYRMHDPRVGRFCSIDPLAAKYPHNSPYAFSENRVIDGIDLEGLEYVSIEGMFMRDHPILAGGIGLSNSAARNTANGVAIIATGAWSGLMNLGYRGYQEGIRQNTVYGDLGPWAQIHSFDENWNWRSRRDLEGRLTPTQGAEVIGAAATVAGPFVKPFTIAGSPVMEFAANFATKTAVKTGLVEGLKALDANSSSSNAAPAQQTEQSYPSGPSGMPGFGPSAPGQSYTVKPGDTLSGLAKTFGTTVDALAGSNGIADPIRSRLDKHYPLDSKYGGCLSSAL